MKDVPDFVLTLAGATMAVFGLYELMSGQNRTDATLTLTAGLALLAGGLIFRPGRGEP